MIGIYVWVSNPMLNAVVSFHINHSDIIERLCEGRFFKENKCQGMCYLNKSIQAQEEVPYHEYAQYELESHQMNGVLSEVYVEASLPSTLTYSSLSLVDHISEVILPPPRS